MKLRIYKSAPAIALLLLFAITSFAQQLAKPKAAVKTTKVTTKANSMVISDDGDMVTVNVNVDKKKLSRLSKKFTATVNTELKAVGSNLSESLDELGPALAQVVDDIDIDVNTDCDVDADVQDDNLQEQVKTYSKTYPAGNDGLVIDNRYGKITVNTWNRNEFKVDVQIKVAGSTLDKAKKMLSQVQIQDAKQGGNVSFRTEIDQGGSSWLSFSGGSNVRKMEINYTVYMPEDNALTIQNRYGSTELPNLKGRVVINNSNGNLNAKYLSNAENAIVVKYGNAAIARLTDGSLNISYGSLSLNECDNVSANISYAGAKIGTIKSAAAINLKYGGGLTINNLDKNFKKLSINSSYSNIKVGMPDAVNGNFAVVVHYGSFNYNNNTIKLVNQLKSNDEDGWNPTQTYKGQLGNGNGANIAIRTNYGSVKFE